MRSNGGRGQTYQIDFTAVASGKRIASSKRRVRWYVGNLAKKILGIRKLEIVYPMMPLSRAFMEWKLKQKIVDFQYMKWLRI